MRRTTIPRAVAVVVALTALVSMLFADEEAGAQATVNVDVGDIYFCSPANAGGVCDTPVNVGDTVMWNWVGILPHTVTECDATFTTCPPSGGFDSGTLTGAGQTFSQTFNTPGTIAYQCNVHTSGMRGRIIVAAQATPTAAATAPAQTGTPGPTGTTAPAATATRTAAPAATTATTPAAVPGTGGDTADGANTWPLALALVGSALLLVSAGVGVAVARRR